VHVTLVSLANIPIYISHVLPALFRYREILKRNNDNGHTQSGSEYRVIGNENTRELTAEKIPVRMHSIVNRCGVSSVKLRPVTQWEGHKGEAVKMLDR